jgi:hypothetical protein
VKDAIVLVVPSRERPQNIAQLWDTLEKTCRTEVTLVVGLDEDDPTRDQYPPRLAYQVRSGLRHVVPWINELAVPLAGQYRFIGHVGDDNVFKTVGWDERVRKALEKTPFAFGNDLYPRTPGSLCCHIFCRSQVVTALGYLGPTGLRHMFVDDVWWRWGQAAGITYLDDVIIEHLHYTVGKSPYDRSYAASTGLMAADRAAFRTYCKSGRLNADIRKIDPAARQYTTEELSIL